MQPTRSINSMLCFRTIAAVCLLVLLFSDKAFAQGQTSERRVGQFDLPQLVSFKKYYNRCSLAKWDGTSLTDTLNSQKEYDQSATKEIDLLLVDHRTSQLYSTDIYPMATDRAILFSSKSPDFAQELSNLVDDLRYDDQFGFESSYDTHSNSYKYLFFAILKDFRIQIHIQDRLSFILID